MYYSFIQSHLIYCSNVWGLGSKSSIKTVFIAQKRAIRTIFFIKLAKKDETTGVYTYGHTKNIFNENDILTLHNLILMQCVNQMQKIYLGMAPFATTLFFSRTEENSVSEPNIAQINKKLQRQGINSNNIISTNFATKSYFNITQSRLTIGNTSISFVGPCAYNYFVNEMNRTTSASKPSLTQILALDTFKERVKSLLLKYQSLGDINTWESVNTLLYTFHTYPIVLRSQLGCTGITQI